MLSDAQPPRAYDSSSRLARAAENRQRIVRAARGLFVANGYAGTAVASVAKAAQVSGPTVYASFGSKANLLKRCIDVALAGDDDDVPVQERPLARWVYEAEDPHELLGRYAVMMGVLASAAGPIYDVLVRAADSEPELAALLADLEQQRLRASTRVVVAVQQRGGLPDGVSLNDARDVVWTCNAPELYVALTQKRGWSTNRYVAWARSTLIKLVIEPPVEGVPSSPPPALLNPGRG